MFDHDPNEQANISGADFAILVDELESLRARVAELESGMGEPVAWEHREHHKLATRFLSHKLLYDDIPLYRTPPTVAAALRKAASSIKLHGGAFKFNTPHETLAGNAVARHAYEAILAIPHDDSALREICMRVAKKMQHRDNHDECVAVVNSVLGEKK